MFFLPTKNSKLLIKASGFKKNLWKRGLLLESSKISGHLKELKKINKKM